jgi:catechol 2,3-dioxygenase-like lactoylglutathione lyase family enzyme
MKTHLNFATTDLPQTIEFYSTLLGKPPAKVREDYALFITEEPALELALDAVDHAPQIGHDHYGVCVESIEQVDIAIARLERAGLVSSVEREQTCCYANQSKVWTADPMGRRWEVYTVHGETDDRDSIECCA